MRYIHVFLLLILFQTFAAAPANATSSGSTSGTTTSGTTTGASCDFSAIKNSLFKTESGGDYSKVNTIGAAGKYQFMPETRETYLRRYPECTPGGISCSGTANWISPQCNQTQECIMDRFMGDNLNQIRKDPACQQLLAGAREVSGPGQGQNLTCKATESGLLAAFHLGGWDECKKMLANGKGDCDKYGTCTAFYTCKHGGLSVPGQCTPTNPDTSATVEQPPGTYMQYEFAVNSGDSQALNFGPPDPLKEWWIAGLMLMAEQFTTNMIEQLNAVGMMFDAKHQLESQRLFQQKVARAHKDYQPSEQMCTFGTFARDLMNTERSADLTKTALAQRVLEREIGSGENIGQTEASDMTSRLALFRDKFCDPKDNGKGLSLLCTKTTDAKMRNRDINYTASVDQPLSLQVNLTDTTVTDDEIAIFALIDNLFAHDPLSRVPDGAIEQKKYQYHYMNLRSIAAMRGVAKNSFSNIIALKSASPDDNTNSSGPYIKALMREFGLPDAEIEEIIGKNPSYYAQMEVLTKKIYQNPTFYTSLYDKPANVKRIRAAMQAIKLMQDRDIEASLMRREMLLSMMLELRLREQAENVYNAAETSMYEEDLQ